MRVRCPYCKKVFLAFRRNNKEWTCPYCKGKILIRELRKKGVYFYGYKVAVKFDDSEYGRALAELFRKGKISLSWNDMAKDLVISRRGEAR